MTIVIQTQRTNTHKKGTQVPSLAPIPIVQTTAPTRNRLPPKAKRKRRFFLTLNNSDKETISLRHSNYYPQNVTFFQNCDSTTNVQKNQFSSPKTKKNLSNLAIFYVFRAFQDYFTLQVDHSTNMTQNTVSHQDHTKIKEQNSNIRSFPQKVIHIARNTDSPSCQTSTDFCSNPPISAQNPAKSVNFQPISLKIPSNTVEIRVFHVKTCYFTSK